MTGTAGTTTQGASAQQASGDRRRQNVAARAAAVGSAVLGPVRRPVGLETELGVTEPGNAYANPVVLASRIVDAYGMVSRPGLTGPDGAPARAVRWDYEGEDPLADQRGGHLDRAAAHPSLLTDDPDRPAPSGSDDLPPAPWGTRPRPTAAEAALPRATTAVLANGARLYVDHAHPEYSSPEVLTPRDAVVWDRAGEVVARRAMAAAARGEGGIVASEVVLYKNNVDGKGSAYGSHENYLLRREVPFEDVAAALIPFLVTRPVLVGAGRVGIGQRSQVAGFQMSQRADYVETDIGLQTTFNRPIVNTRDEPHADAGRYRRLHVINGDANLLEVPLYLKVATTDLVLWYLERAHDRGEGLGALAGLGLTRDPVEEHWAMSHDVSLRYEIRTGRGPLTALAIQRALLDAVRSALVEDGLIAGADGADGPANGHSPVNADPDAAEAVALWDEVLTALERLAAAPSDPAARAAALAGAAPLVEWVAKLQLCEGLQRRAGTGWEDPRLAALDIQWGDLREGRGLAARLIAGGRTRRIVTDAEIEAAADRAPAGTRAAVRGLAVARYPEVVGASWTSLVIDSPVNDRLVRLELMDVDCPPDREARLLDEIRDAIGTPGSEGGH